MLYRGNMQSDVEKEKNLSMYQLNKARFEIQKSQLGAHDLRAANAELKNKIKRYIKLIEEQKVAIEKAEADANVIEDLNEFSVTRKLGHTDMGDISDTFEMGSALNKSVEGGDNYVSRALIDGERSMVAIKQ